MTSKLLLNTSIRKLTPEAFYAFVRSLYIKKISKTQTGVDGVNVSWGKKIIIRISRDPKYITYKELHTLAKEGSVAYDELYRQVRKRKIELRK